MRASLLLLLCLSVSWIQPGREDFTRLDDQRREFILIIYFFYILRCFNILNVETSFHLM